MIRHSETVTDVQSADLGSTENLGLTGNALEVLRNRYLDRNESGEVVESPEGLFRRVAHAIASVESSWGLSTDARREVEDAFFRMMVERRFMPNSPTLMNAGRRLGMLSACFVLPLEDSIPDIMETARQIALVQRAGGGTGVDLSSLRPSGSIVRSSGGTTEGPLSFLRMLSGVTNAIQQGAFRRGANMGMMRIDHPDILAFIDIKADLSEVTNYNLSVAMTDQFMDELQSNPQAVHRVVNPNTRQSAAIRKDGNAVEYDVDTGGRESEYWTKREIWDHIVKRAWTTGEPGLIFIDEVNRYNMTPHVFDMKATNPCGEQPLGPYEACNLGSINLATFFKGAAAADGRAATMGGSDAQRLGEPRIDESSMGTQVGSTSAAAATDDPRAVEPRIDWDGLEKTVRTSIRFLDDVVEANNYPSEEIHKACHGNRKIGLGVMGWADLLFMLGVPYDSEEALALARRIGAFIERTAWDTSSLLADQRGCFPNWRGSSWETKHHRKMRNAQTTTVAPTGTISIIAGCSGGIEPIFSLAFTRQVMEGAKLREVNPVFKTALEQHLGDSAAIEAILDRCSETGTIQDTELPESMKGVFRTARDINPEWHVRMQAAWQEHTDAAVSKTINLAADSDPADVEAAYLLAYQTKCKGITVYRDGSRAAQPMALKSKKNEKGQKVTSATATTTSTATATTTSGASQTSVSISTTKEVRQAITTETTPDIKPIRLPEIMPCVRVRQFTPFGNMHVKISVDAVSGVEREIFAQLGKGGDLATSDLEAICRLVSLFLRCGGHLNMALGQLEGIGSHLTVPTKEGRIMSLADGLARALQKYLRAKERVGHEALLLGQYDERDWSEDGSTTHGTPVSAKGADRDEMFKVKCPDCSGILAYEEGCVKCHSCGYSQC